MTLANPNSIDIEHCGQSFDIIKQWPRTKSSKNFLQTRKTNYANIRRSIEYDRSHASCIFLLCKSPTWNLHVPWPSDIDISSKMVKRLRRRQYDPVIIERTIGLVLGPSTALYEPFLKHCTLTNKAVGIVQTSSEATGSWSLSPLIVSRDSFSHQTWARFQPGGAQPTLFGCR